MLQSRLIRRHDAAEVRRRVEEFADAQWERVARSIPGRSAGDCQWQSRKLAAASRQAWSSEDDQKLLTLAEQQTDVRPPWLECNRNLLLYFLAMPPVVEQMHAWLCLLCKPAPVRWRHHHAIHQRQSLV